MRCFAAWVISLGLVLAVPCRAQDEDDDEPAAGKLLVADDQLLDEPFARTVILLVHHDDDGTVGLVINRPTKTTLSELFPIAAKTTKNHADPVYEGGPVEGTGVLGLVRSRVKLEEGGLVFADVYVTSAKELLEKVAGEGKDPAHFRTYLGYCGWAPGQLDAEIEEGAWHVVEGRATLVFDSDPETLWRRLFEKSGMRVARARRPSNPAVQLVPKNLARL